MPVFGFFFHVLHLPELPDASRYFFLVHSPSHLLLLGLPWFATLTSVLALHLLPSAFGLSIRALDSL